MGCVGVFAIIFMCGSGLAANVNIDVNCTMKPGGSEEASIKKFKEIVEKNSGGRINVKIFMSGQLGKEKAVLELMKIGQTQMALTGGIFWTMFAKQYDPSRFLSIYNFGRRSLWLAPGQATNTADPRRRYRPDNHQLNSTTHHTDVFLIVGCFMSVIESVFIFTPIMAPMVKVVGVDPLFFGVLMVISLSEKLYFPYGFYGVDDYQR